MVKNPRRNDTCGKNIQRETQQNEDMDDLLLLLKALAGRTRILLIQELMLGSECICRLAKRLKLSQPTITANVQKLEKAGLVTVTSKGRERVVTLHASVSVLIKFLHVFATELRSST